MLNSVGWALACVWMFISGMLGKTSMSGRWGRGGRMEGEASTLFFVLNFKRSCHFLLIFRVIYKSTSSDNKKVGE